MFAFNMRGAHSDVDILSHGLWGSLASKALNQRKGKKINLKWAFFWGVFPDIFAFTIPFLYLLYNLITGDASLSDFGPPEDNENGGVFGVAPALYNYSHSLVVFLAVVLIVRLISKRWPWVLLGWLLHILTDIPTHSFEFYPTPILWPLSEAKFRHGISWGQSWFMALNYGLLLVGLLAIRARRRLLKSDPL